MEDGARICPSPLVHYSTGPMQSADGGSYSGASCPSMAESAMVPTTGGDANRLPHPSSMKGRGCRTLSKLRLSNGSSPSSTSRLQGLQLCFKAEGIPEEAVTLILASWRSKTDANYDSAWKNWQAWCSARSTNPFSADLSTVLGFLANQFQEGRQYRSMNIYRSAISSARLPIEGFPLGKHPLVSRPLKGAFNLCPPLPKYSGTWDVGQVTSFVRTNWGENSKLPLKQLTHKLAILLALVLAQRSSDLARLSVLGRHLTQEGMVLAQMGVAKESRPGSKNSLNPVTVARFKQNHQLCPVECLEAYLSASLRFRDSPERQQLFLSFQTPHKPVKPCMIARWIKQVLEASGVDKEVFSAHTTRGAAATAAMQAGITLQQVLDRVGWSSQDTFCRF